MAGDGETVREKAAELEPDLLMVDVAMPSGMCNCAILIDCSRK